MDPHDVCESCRGICSPPEVTCVEQKESASISGFYEIQEPDDEGLQGCPETQEFTRWPFQQDGHHGTA